TAAANRSRTAAAKPRRRCARSTSRASPTTPHLPRHAHQATPKSNPKVRGSPTCHHRNASSRPSLRPSEHSNKSRRRTTFLGTPSGGEKTATHRGRIQQARSSGRLERVQVSCKHRSSVAMSPCSAPLQQTKPDLAWNVHSGGTQRHAFARSRRLITRRSRVQIPPPLLVKAWQQAFTSLRGRWRLPSLDLEGDGRAVDEAPTRGADRE